MASTIIHNVIDDEDEFDWEAAVREIDFACQATTNPSTSNPIHHHHPLHQLSTKPPLTTNIPHSNNTHIKSLPSRQSTLDKFIRKPGPSAPPENRNVGDIDPNKYEGSEGVSCLNIDAEAAKTWIYPVNVPLRDYQLSITRTALFSNTLVALPTGLGKTLIAAVVMYNYFRWFPEGLVYDPQFWNIDMRLGVSTAGKIVFSAPSRPLVMQQIEACHNIVGIPQEWTIDLTGQTSPTRRACLWKDKRVFFVTPQVLEKDIQSGTCLVKHLVCLVIDEAHRAMGNYSYCVAVRELMAVPVQLRILALTATPGSKQQTIQQIIDNLQISTLEYRNENDHDVIPYVHDRKIELIEVAMGQDAVEINNMLLEVIRPFVARLCSIGVLQSRDFQTLSPCDLLNSRDKFRQAPPQDLPSVKCGEVEGYFGALITLYHIRKLLSSHGIRPAYEMLEVKLQQGPFARLMSRNEGIHRAKLLMQQSLSHGAPSPKLSKMLEVLIDHFKMKDPQNSRVIIFSNFRGSVRDIMDALTSIGELVKATQFIGQSSGKTLKGQSQKVQQAVLEKFRAGGYNVIVATSIGEEGLDIMEVDLVICFDANISPLRMIQRMGRTGRKHDGRVACEGSELKGYMRKQANSKAIKKHMRNGGMNSFNFHSSPRMIPHIFKPEVQLIELSIEQFIPRGRKVKDDHPIQTPVFKTKLTDAETDLVAKYFHPTKGSTWRPSLIAFPHFQAIPSRVHRVMHSFRTGMLIDAMQRLQGLSFSRDSKSFFQEDEALSSLDLGVENVEQHENCMKASTHNSPEEYSLRKVSDFDPLPMETSVTKEENCLPDSHGQNLPIHSHLFGSGFVSIDSLGRVLILSVPVLPLKEDSHSKCTSANNTSLLNCLKQDSFHFKASCGDYKDMTLGVKDISGKPASSQTRSKENENMLSSKSCNPDPQTENELDEDGKFCQTPVSKVGLSNEGDSTHKVPQENKTEALLVGDSSNDPRDVELSPRLTNFIKSGVVPESPIDYAGTSKGKGSDKLMVPDLGSPAKSNTDVLLRSSIPEQKEKAAINGSACGSDAPASSVNEEIRTPVLNLKCSATRGSISAFPVNEEVQTPLVNLMNDSCSKDWCLSSGGKSESVQQGKKFKRLCKYGEQGKWRLPEGKEGNVGHKTNPARDCSRQSPILVKNGKRKPVKDVSAFIDEEAGVSSDVEVSDDEEDEQENNSYGDSFIDDRLNPTAASTQAEASRSGMMAIYRRSLLSQSPMETNCSTDFSPDSVASKTRMSECGSSPGTINHSLQTPQTGSESAVRNSTVFHSESEKISSKAILCTRNGGTARENENKMGCRKRKLSFYQDKSVPAINLEQQFLVQSEAAGRETLLQDHQVQKIEANVDVFDDDDQFYAGLDLDAVEEQAAKLLGYKLELSELKRKMIHDATPPQLGILGSPSFDLGI
ncbi:unnamed protein product [Camellia sinensis]